ncbi:MAG TPA: hypothetical protein VIJ47_07215 [Acidimicrobiales bacterium]
MEERCAKHQFEAAEGVCRTCGYDFCGECLVFSFGPNKPPYCLACALTASGVRSNAANPPLRTKREIKLRHKEWMQAREAGHRTAPRVEISAFDDFVTSGAPGNPDENPLSWLDEHLGGTGERVPF